MRKWILVLLLLTPFVLWQGWARWQSRPVSQRPGILVAKDPIQTALAETAPAISDGMFLLHPRARITLSARVLSRADYRHDEGASLAPTDLALGWGPMSDSTVLSSIEINQSNRFYYWHVEQFPIPRREIETHSANMHLIPADEQVRVQLARVRVGEVVHIEGELVDAKRSDGWHWSTSMTRTDTGTGACELVYVRALWRDPAS